MVTYFIYIYELLFLHVYFQHGLPSMDNRLTTIMDALQVWTTGTMGELSPVSALWTL